MRLRIHQRFAGRKGRCPNCRNKMMIPAVDAPGVLLIPEGGTEAAAREEGAPQPEETPAEPTGRRAAPVFDDGAPPDKEGAAGTYVLPPEEIHHYTPPTIELLFQEKAREFITASPRWLLSVAAHVVLLVLLTVMITMTPARPARYIPVQGRFVQAEQPQKMADLQVKEDRPRVEDILTNATTFERATAVRPVVGDLSMPAGPAVGTGDNSAPAVIGIDVGGGAGSFSSLGGGGRRFTPGSLGVGRSSVAFFGSEAKRGAESIIFIVDASVTMGQIGKRFDRAVAELRSSIEKLSAGHRFNIIFFSDQCMEWQKHMVVASPENKRLALEFIESMREFKGAGTLPVPPMKAAFSDGPEVIFLLTDGDFLSDDGAELAAMAKDRKVRVYPIGFGDKVNEPLLKKLADQSGGQYTLPKL